MKITCSGPSGEKFEASGAAWMGGRVSDCDSANRSDRESMQKALETWCEAVKADKEKAVVAV